MKGYGGKLPRKQHKAIASLMSCRTIKEAAEKTGVGEATIFRWLQNEGFQKAYRAAKRAVIQQAVTRLQQISGEAVEILKKIMLDSGKPASARVTAARIILDLSLKAFELEDLEARVETLEAKINGAKL